MPGGHHHHHSTVVHVFDENLLSGSLFALKTTGADSQCGCPGCHGGTLTCSVNKHFLPNELNGKLTKDELNDFTNEIDRILSKYHWPMLPCLFAHFCLPFSPVCAMMYCQSARLSHIKVAIDVANEKIVERGLYWELIGGNGMYHGYIANLKVNDEAYQRFMSTQPNRNYETNANVAYATPIMASAPAVEMAMVRGDDKHGAYAPVVDAVAYEAV